jgi:hypothetical protein
LFIVFRWTHPQEISHQEERRSSVEGVGASDGEELHAFVPGDAPLGEAAFYLHGELAYYLPGVHVELALDLLVLLTYPLPK